MTDLSDLLTTSMVAPGFEAVRDAFTTVLDEAPDLGAQVAAYWRGERVVDLRGGPGIDASSITGVYSVTKGVAGLMIALLLQRGALGLDDRVRRYWPEFAAAGKADVTVRQLLTHQAGLVAPPNGLTVDGLCSSEELAAELAAAAPLWRPGTAFGYHGLTIGVFMEELYRRIEHRTLQQAFRQDVQEPEGVDFYLGLSPDEERRFLPVLPPLPAPPPNAEGAHPPDDLHALAMSTGRTEESGEVDIGYLANDPRIRSAGVAAVGGVGSAEGLARLYAAAVTGVEGGSPFLTGHTRELVAQQQVWGVDRVLNVPMCFGVVFMKPQPRMPFASHRAFGHDGASGGIGFADPLYECSMGYVPQRRSGEENDRFTRLSHALRDAISALTA